MRTAWRASLDDVLLSPANGRPEPVRAVVNELLEHVTDALDEAGGTGTVSELLAALETCPPAQRCPPGQQAAHDRHRGAAQEQPGPGRVRSPRGHVPAG